MSVILAVDPGLTHPGAALVRDGVLVSAERVRVPSCHIDTPILARCYNVAAQIAVWTSRLGEVGSTIDLLIVEWPRWYGRGGKSIDPNDLAGLCGISGAVLGHLQGTSRNARLIEVLSPTPSEVWGSLPKVTTGDPWASPRGRRLASKLSEAERASVQSKHDALDAAGLALFAAGRWKQQRSYPGAVPRSSGATRGGASAI